MTVAAPANKTCGDCKLCCKVMAIETLAKPAGSWCPHCKQRTGCGIYQRRPDECRNYTCLWLVDERLDQRWKPNKSKLVLTTSEDGIEVRCDPGFPDAWRKEPYRRVIQGWAAAGESHDVTVLVITGERMTLVTSSREFDLGVVRSDQRIVREIEGTAVVNVRVVDAGDLARQA